MGRSMLEVEVARPGYTLRAVIDAAGRHTIFVDGAVAASKLVLGMKGEHAFERGVNGRTTPITIILKMSGPFSCRCQVLEHGEEVHNSDHRLAMPGMGDSFKGSFSGAPRWAWIFIGLCLVIPIVTLGGAVPAVVGIGGAAGCAAIARQSSWPAVARVLLCVAVTVLSWIAVLFALSSLRGVMPAK